MAKIATVLPNAVIEMDRSSTVALHRQLYDRLRKAILSGELAAGTRLPSTRELARELNVARNTVVNAFDQLYAESYLEARTGDGTYVSRQLPDDLINARNERLSMENSRTNTLAPLPKWASICRISSATPGTPSRPGPASKSRADRLFAALVPAGSSV